LPWGIDLKWIVDLKVHVEIVHYKGRQGSNMRPRESFFWVRECFFCERFNQRFQHETPAKDKCWVRERFTKVLFLFAKNGPFADKGI
jgi:hypothetical protein